MSDVSESDLTAFGEWIQRSGDRLIFASGQPEKGVRHFERPATLEQLTQWANNWSGEGNAAKAEALANAAWTKVHADGVF